MIMIFPFHLKSDEEKGPIVRGLDDDPVFNV